MAEVIVEPNTQYDILINEDDEVLIAMKAHLSSEKAPKMLYDGKDKVLLYRTPDQLIYLSELPTPVQEVLTKLKKLLMVEVQDNAIIREYMVPLTQVEQIPV